MGMEIHALPHWRHIDFISDLHLQAEAPATFEAWKKYLHHTTADALFILGDLFEVWVGDDILNDTASFEAQCARALKQTSERLAIYIMHGNRDFLMGPACMLASHATLIHDPSVLVTAQQRWLLTHGDALCIEDTAYMQFRSQVRTTDWQHTFLSQALALRLDMARNMRQQSESRKQSAVNYADLDAELALEWLQQHHAQHMIHGHTHKPAQHELSNKSSRWVLSDWDLECSPPRADVLRLNIDSTATLQRLSLQEATDKPTK